MEDAATQGFMLKRYLITFHLHNLAQPVFLAKMVRVVQLFKKYYSSKVPICVEYENGEVLGTLPADDYSRGHLIEDRYANRYTTELLSNAIAALIHASSSPLSGAGLFGLTVKMPHVCFDLLDPVPSATLPKDAQRLYLLLVDDWCQAK